MNTSSRRSARPLLRPLCPAHCGILFCLSLFSAQLLWPVAAMAQSVEEPVAQQQPDAAANPAAAETTDLQITELAEQITRSLVMVRVTGRDNQVQGHGSGFVVSEDGLIATARHVIGDRRMVRVELPDGTLVPATHVYPAAEGLDIVLVKVDATGLVPLPLGPKGRARVGQSVVSVGHPGSLKYSTFSGIVSGYKEIEDLEMLQLAMTVERGASGEPVVDRQGRVIGMVTLKSNEVANLGFAVPVSHLQRLLEDPTPVPMDRWMTIGALDPKRWQTVFGANWSQRAGRILVEGTGSSFGGRSLCLQTSNDLPDVFELQVDVKLADERGAAGLAFHADGQDRHYGFYPSNGNLRLTRFDGPDVQSWTILHNESHPAYRSGDWNTFKVRIEADRMLCYVNDQLVVTSTDSDLPRGQPGLATFRGTSAEFRKFQTGATLPATMPEKSEREAIDRILAEVTHRRPATQDVIQQMQPFRRYSSRLLKERAQQLEQQAERLRQLAIGVHAAAVRLQILEALGRTVETPAVQPTDASPEPNAAPAAAVDSQPDLLKAALLIAALDNEEVDADAYVDRVDQLADEIRQELPENPSEADRLKALDRILFEEYGFRGSRLDYYTRFNSYLNEVIDDREGLPITLSVLYMELAKRLDLKVVGLGLPGHFVVRFEPQADPDAESEIVDVFNRGKRLSEEEAKNIIRSRGSQVFPQFFEAQSPEAIIQRMLVNLLNLAENSRDDERVLRYLEMLVAMEPDALEFRAKRLEIRARTERLAEAIQDVDWFLNQESDAIDKDRLYELRAELQRQQDQLNP